MRVVALFRVSTEKQANEGASLDAQERTYRDLAARNGWTTVAEFRGCESATQAGSERVVLQRVLGCLRDNDVDGLWVIELSRLSRGDELETALLMRELRERRVKIIVNGLVRDPSQIDESFMLGIQSLVDRAESQRIKERMTRGKNEKAKRGQKNSGAATFGYVNPPPGQPGRGTLQIVPERAAIVRRIFALAASGKGALAVARAMNDAGIPAPRGGKWGKATVRNMLCCVTYLGTHVTNVWVRKKGSRNSRMCLDNPQAIIVEKAHEPIIDRQTWDEIHNRPHLPRTAAPRLLTGLLYVDGLPYRGGFNRETPCYRARSGILHRPRLDALSTEDRVWDAFTSLATSEAFVERLMQEAHNPREQAVLGMEIEHLEDQVGKLQRRLDRLVEMRADGEIDKATYQSKSDDARGSIERMSAELAELRGKRVALDGTHAARVTKAVQMLLAGRTRLSLDQKRAVLRSIVRRIDATAAATGVPHPRHDERKRFVPGSGGARWAIQAVSFRLALPSDRPIAGVPEIPRDGHLVTSSWERAQASATDNMEGAGSRAGDLVTPCCNGAQAADTDSMESRAGDLGTPC